MFPEAAKKMEEASQQAVGGLQGLNERLGRIQQFVKKVEYMLVEESQRVGQLEQGYESTLESLEAQLEEKEGLLQRKEEALKKLEENTRELQEMRAKIEETQASAKAELQQLGEIMSNWEKATAALVFQGRRAEEEIERKSRAIKEMEDSLSHFEETIMDHITELEQKVQTLGEKR